MCLLIHTRITRELNKPWRPRKVRLIKQIFDIRIYSWGSEFEFELAMIGESGTRRLDLQVALGLQRGGTHGNFVGATMFTAAQR